MAASNWRVSAKYATQEYMRTQAFVLFFLILLALSGCADKHSSPTPDRQEPGTKTALPPITDPQGPIPEPTLPPELAKEQPPASPAPSGQQSGLTYTIDCRVRGASSRDARQPPPADTEKKSKTEQDADNAEVLLSTFEKISILYRLQDTPPDSLTGLEQRLAVALDEARDILKSQGYYSGKVWGRIKKTENKSAEGDGKEAVRAVARVTFLPGPRYRMGKTEVTAALPLSLREEEPKTFARLPRTLADAGLEENAPAVAADVLAAVERVREIYHNNGFPQADTASTRYVIDHQTRTLEAEVHITPGPFLRIGDIERHGAPSVRDSYVQNLRTWRKGRPWNQSRVEAFRDALRQSGLFQSIDLSPAEANDAEGRRAVVTKLEGAAERTVSGAIKYHTDFGPGVQANWEHRNLTGRGDSLRIALPLWMDMQELTANYRLPFFLRRDQDFIAGGGLLNQDTDAYRLTSGSFSAGVERRLARHWRASVKGSVEGGTIKEPDEPSRDYIMYGIPLGLTYDNTGSLLDAVKGQRVLLSVTPYTGSYEGAFTILRSRLDARSFLPLVGEDKLVLALRGVVGVIDGAESGKVPPSVRFYSGGGGSVRGYEFQSIGPRDKDDNPLGGGSQVEMSAETRWKVAPEWGLVAFLDGGTVYENTFENPSEVMRFGAGIGFRYYTAIGPVRLDLATPVNPRSDDDPFQLYISIGQSF